MDELEMTTPVKPKAKKVNRKVVITSLVCLVLVGALVAAYFLIPRTPTTPVKVYDLATVGYVYEDVNLGQTFSGTVRSDNLQVEYLSDTQQVTEVFVKEGQVVKAGDALFSYDTTLDSLAVERKDLEVQQLQLNLQIAKDDLKAINKLKPMVIPATTKPTEAPTEAPFEGKLESEEDYRYISGSWTARSPAVYWIREDFAIEDHFVWELFSTAASMQNKAEGVNSFYVIFVTREGDEADGDIVSRVGLRYERVQGQTVTEPVETTAPSSSAVESSGETSQENPPATEPDDGSVPAETTVTTTADTYRFTFFSPDEEQKESTSTSTGVQINSGYTSNEIAQMREEKNAEIKQLEFDLKMSQAELAIMEQEVSDGIVRATVGGKVMRVLTAEEAQESGEPLVRISGGAYLITAYVSEWYLSGIAVGDTATVTSWLTGENYTGTVYAVSDFPASDYSTQHESYYAVTVRVGEESQLSVDYGVDVSFGGTGELQTVYWLDQAFVREDEQGWYVWAADGEGLLEKRYVQVSTSDGSMVQVLSGISETDCFAFPYGDDVAVGAPTELGSWDELYG